MKKTCYRRKKAYAIGEKFDALEIFNRDGWVCGICCRQVDEMLDYPNEMSASLDHIKSLREFDDSTLDQFHTRANSQCSHLKCNYDKADMDLEDIKGLLGS